MGPEFPSLSLIPLPLDVMPAGGLRGAGATGGCRG
jgi:hypothetical protein